MGSELIRRGAASIVTPGYVLCLVVQEMTIALWIGVVNPVVVEDSKQEERLNAHGWIFRLVSVARALKPHPDLGSAAGAPANAVSVRGFLILPRLGLEDELGIRLEMGTEAIARGNGLAKCEKTDLHVLLGGC